MIRLPINCDIFKYQPIKSLLTPIFGKAILFTHFTFVDISALIWWGHGHGIDLDHRVELYGGTAFWAAVGNPTHSD